MDIVLATQNTSKIVQILPMFEGSPINLFSMSHVEIKGKAPENGKNLRENALEKAQYAFDRAPFRIRTMADDTGLFIDGLKGKPGHHAARWAGEKATTEEITAYTLMRLRGAENRRATFKTVVAVITLEGIPHFFQGEVRGTILEEPQCAPQPDMPYSPIFLPDGQTKVWAEMTTEEENAISHRGIAFRAARKFLEGQLKFAAR
ncbi:MAG: deoxyribonucleotide triphosphate pyrophosphatase [Parcubacteria group bacterium]|nr:deoxyribonucleotide triphosphate pyrophosphatase [Parcubacteria group bacterium]